MRYLSIAEILEIHDRLLTETGGASGVRDLGALESCVAQPRVTFGGQDLYPDLASKVSALCFSLVMNHPLVDGNKRIGHAAMEVFLLLNSRQFDCDVDEQEGVMLSLAAGDIPRQAFTNWVTNHIDPDRVKRRGQALT